MEGKEGKEEKHQTIGGSRTAQMPRSPIPNFLACLMPKSILFFSAPAPLYSQASLSFSALLFYSQY